MSLIKLIPCVSHIPLQSHDIPPLTQYKTKESEQGMAGQPAQAFQSHDNLPSISAGASILAFDSYSMHKEMTDEFEFRAGIILSAIDFVLEGGRSFRESLGVAITGREWP